MSIRCFIAIELSREIREALGDIEEELKRTISGVRWVGPDNIHLTLKFIGHVEKETVEKIKEILTQTASEEHAFDITLSSLGAFPSPGQPRVIWLGIAEGSKESTSLANAIEGKLALLGIEKENRAFHSHLTLGRVNFLKDKSSVKTAFASLKVPPKKMTASKLTLFQSTLTREGSIYSVLHEAEFNKP